MHAPSPGIREKKKKEKKKKGVVFQKLLKAGANRRVRMCNLQSAKDCASVKTSLATVHALAQEMGNQNQERATLIYADQFRAGSFSITWSVRAKSHRTPQFHVLRATVQVIRFAVVSDSKNDLTAQKGVSLTVGKQ